MPKDEGKITSTERTYDQLALIGQSHILRSVIEDVLRRTVKADDDPTHYVTSEGRNFGQYTTKQMIDMTLLVSQPQIDATSKLVSLLKKQLSEVDRIP